MTRDTILVINGPNLNLLGLREPEIYGTQTLKDIESLSTAAARAHGLKTDCRQSNHEGEIVTWIQGALLDKKLARRLCGIVINAGAYTHTSIAIHDALRALPAALPVVEVHLSDPTTREAFRHVSYIEPLAAAVFKGLGAEGYAHAIDFLAKKVNGPDS